ncbi:MAG: hypothetical protein Ct9H300mP28_24110 [Pseudomonadota bacterium]|nr:MAG: hypothetical protein Ct9H300mP28_24110 [Pseudomonadota bacterium]
MDAILGALALGDIGEHFPDTEMNLKGATAWYFLVCSKMIEEKDIAVKILTASSLQRNRNLNLHWGDAENLAFVLKIKLSVVKFKGNNN